MKRGNLYSNIPETMPEELFETLSSGAGNLKIERIVSRQHCSPPDFQYDQSSTEWVMVLQGAAVLRFADQDEIVTMKRGDWIEITPGQKHRVDSTSETEDTIWLAVHWG